MRYLIVKNNEVLNVIELDPENIGIYTPEPSDSELIQNDTLSVGDLVKKPPTVEERITQLEQDNLTTLEAIAEVYELTLGGI